MTDWKDAFRTAVVYATAAIALLYTLWQLFHMVDTGKLAAEVAIPIIAAIISGVLGFLFGVQSNRETVHLANSTPGPVQVGPDNATVTVTAPGQQVDPQA